MIEILNQIIGINYTKSNNRDIKYIVIHNTGNPTADAQQHYKYWNTNKNANSSAHYVVDDKCIIRLVKHEDVSWHCGRKYGDAEFMDCTNNNSIGIEICNHETCNFDKAMSNAIELVKVLMKELNIPVDRVISHYQACKKQCPATIIRLDKWEWFKEQLVAKEKEVYWRVVTNSYKDIELARKEVQELNDKGINAFIVKYEVGD